MTEDIAHRIATIFEEETGGTVETEVILQAVRSDAGAGRLPREDEIRKIIAFRDLMTEEEMAAEIPFPSLIRAIVES